ncbi:MAG: hypothetical protein UY01_C0034G0005 [Candidatus Nomurabacteria bacterium GW2011_GWB1_47_6]|uniref:Uncharacterized protein n=1 Tax=Candidatus Nomurabacteria bacterium GW2011_GWB1_47_6 TaxID=1618749 RepID=A0A0G1VWL6_9BACT|nr:MAG: hypothetical protein UY01_C0034G0005 [Candidatus Nomurabacteria bacterium GW2011_GWB1_47_6]
MSYKYWTLVALVFIAAFSFWLAVRPWLDNPLDVTQQALWLKPLIGLLVSAMLVCLTMVLTARPKGATRLGWTDLVVALAVVLPYWLIFVWPNTTTLLNADWYYYLSGGVVAGLFLLWGAEQIHKDRQRHLNFSLTSAVGAGAYKVITALLLLVSLAYYFNPSVQDTARRDQLSESTRRTVQVFTMKLVEQQAGGEVSESAFRKAFLESWHQLNQFLRPYFYLMPPLLAIGLFLVLRGFAFLFFYLMLLLLWVAWLLLRWAKVITMEKQTVEIEIPKL